MSIVPRCDSELALGSHGYTMVLPCEKRLGHAGDHQYLGEDGTYAFKVLWSEEGRLP